MKLRVKPIVTNLLVSFLLLAFSLCAEPFSPEQLKWLESDSDHPTAHVNEGELTFLSASSEIEHLHENTLWIDDETITTGWARLDQCHTNLDAVPRLDIVYNKARIRDLRIISLQGIGSGVAHSHEVVLHNIESGSKVCIQADSRVLHPGNQLDTYHLINGPFMRQFLDGFYPLQLKFTVNYPQKRLKLMSVKPEAQSGWNVRYDAGRVYMQGRFEGKLKTHLIFERKLESL